MRLPVTWKRAIIILIPKPGKDHSVLTSNWPIALKSTLCKVMERMNNSRQNYVYWGRNVEVDKGFNMFVHVHIRRSSNTVIHISMSWYI